MEAPIKTTQHISISPGEQIDHFRIIRLLGSGGVGAVYLARDLQLGRKVALKLVDPEQTSFSREQVMFEAKAMARFNHPHIMTIFAVGEYKDTPYLALEYLEGETLRDRIEQGGTSIKETMRIACSIADALQEAHRNGLTHRDLKPENVFLPTDGRLRVLDFGLAQYQPTETLKPTSDLDGEGLSQPNDAPKAGGTPSYMSPEQWSHKALTPATDIWSFGVMLYELCVGHRPYQSEETSPLNLAFHVSMPGAVPGLDQLSHVPGTLAEWISRCLQKDPDARPTSQALAQGLIALLDTKEAPPEETGLLPFPGLRPFTPRDADFFFGRDIEMTRLLERLKRSSVVPIVGPPGVGKSSLLQAGLLPKLQQQGGWHILQLQPGQLPFRALATTLQQPQTNPLERTVPSLELDAFPNEPQHTSRLPSPSLADFDVDDDELRTIQLDSLSSLSPQPTALLQQEAQLAGELQSNPYLLGVLLRHLAEQEGKRVLLIVDQLDELFLNTTNAQLQQDFLRCLGQAADDPMEPVRVIVSMRGDSLDQIAGSSEVQDMFRDIMLLWNPTESAYREIITAPLAQLQYRYDEPGLIDHMVEEIKGEASGLPLLQFSLALLWSHRDRDARTLRNATYEQMGGIGGALVRHAETVFASLSGTQRPHVKQLCLQLVTTHRTRRQLSRKQLLQGTPPETRDDAARVLDKLLQERLVTTQTSNTGTTMELAHISLVQQWQRLQQWLDESSEERRFVEEVEQAASLWEQRGSRREELWGEDAFFEASRTIERLQLSLPIQAQRFIDACQMRQRETHQQQLTRRRRRNWQLSVGVLLIIAISVVVSLAFEQKSRFAEQQKQSAQSQRASTQQKAALTTLQKGQPNAAKALVRASLETKDSSVTRLLWWRLTQQPLLWQRKLDALIYDMNFSADSQHLAAASQYRSVYVFGLKQQSIKVLRERRDQVLNASFIDTSRLLSLNLAGELFLWSAPTKKRHHWGKRKLNIPKGRKFGLAMHPSKPWVAFGRHSNIEIWNVQTTRRLMQLRGHRARVFNVAWSPKGERLASVSTDKTVRLWELDPRRPNQHKVFRGHTQLPLTVAFHPKGTLLASAGVDRTIRLWPLTQTPAIKVLTGHSGHIYRVRFHPNGRWLASGSLDKSARLWDVENGRLLRTIRRHKGPVAAIAFSPDGKRLATAGADHTIMMWDVDRLRQTPSQQKHKSPIYQAAFSTNQQWVISVGRQTHIHVRNAINGRHAFSLRGEDTRMRSLAVGPKGKWLLASNPKGDIAIWDLKQRRFHGEIHTNTPLRHIAIHPNGQLVATSGFSGEVKTWDIATKKRRHSTRVEGAKMSSLCFSPKGNMLAVSAHDNTVTLLKYPGLKRLRSVQLDAQKSSTPRRLFFHPTQRKLFVVRSDGKFFAWDWKQKQATLVYSLPHRTNDANISPTGDTVAFGLHNGTIQLLDLKTNKRRQLRGTPHSSEVNSVQFSKDGHYLVSASDDTTVRVWQLINDAPLWHNRLFLPQSRTLLSHNGWRSFGHAKGPDQVLRQWAESITKQQPQSVVDPSQTWLCQLSSKHKLQVWHIGARRKEVEQHIPPPVHQLVAGRKGCYVRSNNKIWRYGPKGKGQLPQQSARLLQDDEHIYALYASKLHVIEGPTPRGTVITLPQTEGLSALTSTKTHWLMGFDNGNIQSTPIDGQGKTVLFQETPTGGVSQLIVSNGLLFAGFTSGDIGIWSGKDGSRLFASTLHGEIAHLSYSAPHLVAISALGDTMTWQLKPLIMPYCELMREIWRDNHRNGHTSRAPRHRCRRQASR